MTPNGASSTGDAQASNAGLKGSSWSRFHGRINEVANNFFYRLGYRVATNPKRTLLISLAFVVACCFGFANFTIEADGEDLWVPADSLARDHQSIVLEDFDGDGEFASFLVESPSETGSVLTKESVDAIWELDAIVRAVEVGGNTYADVCGKELDGVTCEPVFRGITRFWGDFATYEASVTSDADILATVNVATFPDGSTVNQQALFGNGITYDDDGNISGARATIQGFALDSDPDDGADINEDVFDWNEAFQDAMDEAANNFDVFDVFYLTSRSTDDALNESVTGEMFLFIITCEEIVTSYKWLSKNFSQPSFAADAIALRAYVLMIAVVSVALGRCCSGPVKRRSWLGVGGTVLVAAAGLAAYGLNSGFHIPFTSLSQILPFILIGIGVDDMFVIVAAYDHTDPSLAVEERIALGVKRCGVSVTYTSLTNFFAFLLGSMTSLPAVEYFCLYAATAILFDFFLQMTAFVALLTMDANRQKAGKIDCCCCLTSKKYLQEQERQHQEGIQRGVTLPNSNGESAFNAQGKHDLKAEVHQISPMGRFMKDKCSPFVLSAKGKALVLLGSAGLLAAGIYGVTQATQGFDVLDLAPDGHYSIEYTERSRKYDFDIQEWYVPMDVYTQEVDYPDVAVQAEMQSVDEEMLELKNVAAPLDSWLVSFIVWAEVNTTYSANIGTSGGYPVYDDRDTFYTALSAFLADEDNARFLADVVFDDEGIIKISRSEMYLINLVDTDKNVDVLRDTREVADQSTLDPQPFAYSAVFLFSEQYVVIYNELLSSFGLALLAVLVLSLFVLGKVTVVLLVCVTLIIIDVELLGFVYHWNLDVNSITVIELIMAVGLVVEYMVHIVHYFLHQDPSIPKDARIAEALGEIGPSVMVGAATTFLGIMPLAFANNVIFRVFFKMFLVIISFGFFHGVVFIPVLLSMLPDRLVSHSGHEEGTASITRHTGSKKVVVLEGPMPVETTD
ncbi:conserved unknown protein [Ectocarpus siliculosus]|uniref:SSD domain-containing protein n=1 Tax=Ectocarpus siliculosus TaxID=2880 RepID=D7FY95_ECTSI|nr:conserved unknown protein [Ectocarpus siliculosus]|eukprot:CBJ26534.1 conserved unknown protein [Ectocarpus siliculosus]